MSFIVTPLIAGIFDDTQLPRLIHGPAFRASLFPVTQVSTLSGAFTYVAYHAEWLNGTFPPFTTPVYALLPFGIHQNAQTFGVELWTADTTLFEAELCCESAGTISITSRMIPGSVRTSLHKTERTRSSSVTNGERMLNYYSLSPTPTPTPPTPPTPPKSGLGPPGTLS